MAAATSYLCLFLHYLGLGTTWMSGPVQAKVEIEQLLDVSPEWDFVDLIPVGYPAGESKTPPRRPIEEAVQFFR
ncbi:MAG: nitroreductase family protein [Deltaproteobacteria bacterium]|nr:nitroreductase family protein [Deltaproteobacteria bacterium]